MAIKYIATFADGKIVKRTSASGRQYSHCWRIQYVSQTGTSYDTTGFSGALHHAAAEIRKCERWAQSVSEREIVPAVVVEAKPRAVKS